MFLRKATTFPRNISFIFEWDTDLFLSIKHLNHGLANCLKHILIQMSHIIAHGVPGRTETALLTVRIISNHIYSRNLSLLVDRNTHHQ